MSAPLMYFHRANPAEPDRTMCAREKFGTQTVDRETLDRLTALEAGRPCPTCWPTEGPHLFRCASPDCPGYPWRASASPHPCNP